MNTCVRLLALILFLLSCAGAVEAITIADAKLLADGTPNVILTGKVVTATGSGFFYIEEDKGNGGLRVENANHTLAVNMRANVTGTMRTNGDKERYLEASLAVQNGTGTIKPAILVNEAVGGGPWFYQPTVGNKGQAGVINGEGLNTTGLLVTTTGRVKYVDPAGAFAYINDGSDSNDLNTLGSGGSVVLGVRVLLTGGITMPSPDNYTTVTGISRIITVGSHPAKAIWPRTQADIRWDESAMVYIPAGAFQMGNSGLGDDIAYSSPDELPAHTVFLSGYWIGKYEVTRGEYRRFINAGGYANSAFWSADGWSWRTINGVTQPQNYWDAAQDWGTGSFTQSENHPVVGITYYEAEAYCNWAGGHLPTEAQWEKAARWDGHARIYPWGDVWDYQKCNNLSDTNSAGGGFESYQTAPVGSYPQGASFYGCMDMGGNVSEWCKDWYDENYYSQTPAGGWIDPQGPLSSGAGTPRRVLRDGNWVYDGTNGFPFRCAYRDFLPPEGSYFIYGFRLAR